MGHFYNDKEDVCEKCPVDYYQDKEAKSSCVPCSKGTSTLGQEASKSRKECLGIPSLLYLWQQLSSKITINERAVGVSWLMGGTLQVAFNDIVNYGKPKLTVIGRLL